jgi:flagellar basal body-associated protein FliL
MSRQQIVAIITGAISVILALAYLLIVFFLDSRGEMLPAPQSSIFTEQVQIVNVSEQINFNYLGKNRKGRWVLG